jgi:DNA-binding NtrC family response regulator
MKSTAVWDRDLSNDLSQPEQVDETPANGAEDPNGSYNKIETLKDLTFKILREVQSMREINTPSIDSGIDFYDEVTRFEVDLIKRALTHTGGHQGRAARLLNLKITTLNSKIKHYGIELAGFTTGYAFGGGADTRTRQHA